MYPAHLIVTGLIYNGGIYNAFTGDKEHKYGDSLFI